MTESLILKFWVAVTWIPSALGLFILTRTWKFDRFKEISCVLRDNNGSTCFRRTSLVPCMLQYLKKSQQKKKSSNLIFSEKIKEMGLTTKWSWLIRTSLSLRNTLFNELIVVEVFVCLESLELIFLSCSRKSAYGFCW